ncbi:hypothetical protein GYB61_04540 [bacterium]|nr:hypothetical protein [bacterium]
MGVYKHTVSGFDGYRIAVSVGGKLRQAYRKDYDEALQLNAAFKRDQLAARKQSAARAKPTKSASMRGGVRGIFFDRDDRAFVVRATLARFPVSQGTEQAWLRACQNLAQTKGIDMPEDWPGRLPKRLPSKPRTMRRSRRNEPLPATEDRPAAQAGQLRQA